MTGRNADAIRRSWDANAAAWIDAVRNGRIATRVRVTDRAILEAVLAHAPSRVLDVGCGEGWPCRARGMRRSRPAQLPQGLSGTVCGIGGLYRCDIHRVNLYRKT